MNYFDYFLFIFSVVIMIATPGPVMILVASAGLKGGYKSTGNHFWYKPSIPCFNFYFSTGFKRSTEC